VSFPKFLFVLFVVFYWSALFIISTEGINIAREARKTPCCAVEHH